MLMVIEFLQLLALTLSVKPFTRSLPFAATEFLRITQMSILDLHEITDLSDGRFYVLFNLVIGVLTLFFIFAVISLTPLKRFAKRLIFLSGFVYYKAYIILVVACLGFVPYIFVLSNVFVCIEKIEERSYLQLD
jgi:hypothetical protein